MLFGEDARREGLFGVVVADGDDALRDDGAAVEGLVNKVDGAAGKLHAVMERLALRIEAGKGREQARMNVENAPAISFDKERREQPHETGEADEINSPRAKRRDDVALMLFTQTLPTLNDERLYLALRRVAETCGIVFIADDNGDFRIRDAPVAHRVGEREHV